MQEYRLQIDKAAKPLLIIDYTFGTDRSLESLKSTNLPPALQNAKVKTEFDLANAWSTFMRKYL